MEQMPKAKLLKILIAAFISSGAYYLYAERHANQWRRRPGTSGEALVMNESQSPSRGTQLQAACAALDETQSVLS